MPPPSWFGDACAEAGLRLLIGWPWPSYTDFLRKEEGRRAVLEEVRRVVAAGRGQSAVLGYVIGNEVPATLVRWMGRERVRDFLERLVEIGRRAHPEALFAYATFPSTEYLAPRNADFFACNIYLEERAAFERYLPRLHLLAGDKPLVISEFGIDSQHHGEARQAETLAWAWDAARQAGVAGQVWFTFTDEWFNDGRLMTEWAFGLVTAGRQEKAVCHRLRERLADAARPGPDLAARGLAWWPRFSVIICTYNGARTLRATLESLRRLTWRDFEVLLVDDGSTDEGVARVAAEFREVRAYRIAHAGLSAARNFGARQATGDVLVYLDDDAAADEDWLTWLALCFQDERVGAAGGPNLPPPAHGIIEAAIARAPGGPAHVLLNDTDAEHLPGCNLAVRADAWKEVGGFDERYRTAGDDVDFCWRLLEHGYKLRFHPAAMVWHERRRTCRAYFLQQRGYGRAEALLIAQHRHRFGKLGGARWHGTIYEAPAVARGAFLYQGVFGSAPYQFLYTASRAAWRDLVTSPPWLLLAAGVGVASWALPHGAGWLALLLLAAPVGVAWWIVRRAPPPVMHPPAGPGRRWLEAAVLFFLTLGQPVVRGFARWRGCLSHRAFPQGPWLSGPLRGWSSGVGRPVAESAWWTDHGRDREVLLTALTDAFAQTPWRPRTGDAWSDWDFQLSPSLWWTVRGVTVTEYHQRGGCLTRLRLHSRANRMTRALGALSVLAVVVLAALHLPWGLWALGSSLGFWGLLAVYHAAVVRLVMRVVRHTARQHGLRLIEEEAGGEMDEMDAAVEEARPLRGGGVPPTAEEASR